MIDAQHLTVRFGDTVAVDNLRLEVAAGERVALWGGNGAGKTTVIRALLGLVRAEGDLRIAGHDVQRHGRKARAAVGYVPQQLAFWDDMGALAVLRFLAKLRGAPDAVAPVQLERVGLAAHARKPVGALSGGMRQRLALAAAMLDDPPILILDEPTANLDAEARRVFTELIADLGADGRTLLLTSHRLDEVNALADRVLVLADGHVVQRCAAEELEAVVHPRITLVISLDEPSIPDALALLERDGFSARRNGRGVKVAVAPGRRAAPVEALVKADIPVRDLHLEEAR